VEAVSLASPIERMPALIRSMSSVPANLLFSVGNRLTEPRLRWAPISVRRANGGYITTVIDDMVQWMPEAPGGRSRMIRPLSRLAAQGRGLLTFLPAFYTIAVVLSNVAYNVIPRALDHDIISRLLEGSRPIAILVSEFNPDSHMTSGVVVEGLSDHLSAADFDHSLEQERAAQVRFYMPVTLQPKHASQVGRSIKQRL
jgi:hypothetical protein